MKLNKDVSEDTFLYFVLQQIDKAAGYKKTKIFLCLFQPTFFSKLKHPRFFCRSLTA